LQNIRHRPGRPVRPARFAVFGLCLAAAVGLSALGLSTPARAADLTVTVDHLRDDRGVIRITVFNSAKTWLDDQHDTADMEIKAQPGEVTAHFHGLPPGRYAVVTLDDYNDDGKMDYGFFGFPKKGYAFSNDVRPFLRAPSFRRAAVDVPESGAAIRIKMVY
jgi:uncharacterized protein (DUF2141 family)